MNSSLDSTLVEHDISRALIDAFKTAIVIHGGPMPEGYRAAPPYVEAAFLAECLMGFRAAQCRAVVEAPADDSLTIKQLHVAVVHFQTEMQRLCRRLELLEPARPAAPPLKPSFTSLTPPEAPPATTLSEVR